MHITKMKTQFEAMDRVGAKFNADLATETALNSQVRVEMGHRYAYKKAFLDTSFYLNKTLGDTYFPQSSDAVVNDKLNLIGREDFELKKSPFSFGFMLRLGGSFDIKLSEMVYNGSLYFLGGLDISKPVMSKRFVDKDKWFFKGLAGFGTALNYKQNSIGVEYLFGYGKRNYKSGLRFNRDGRSTVSDFDLKDYSHNIFLTYRYYFKD